jgi:hypothetical protein
MDQETRTCQSCKVSFVIELEDFDFYKKIDVPAPTWCPECRLLRRMMWRNSRCLYKRPCSVPGHTEQIISVYAPENPIAVVYDHDYWWSDAWDPLANGRAYDFSVPFFTQLASLLTTTPFVNLSGMNNVRSEYVNICMELKNCYLVFASTQNEDCSYSEGINSCRDCLDLLSSREMERCYGCTDCSGCFNVIFSAMALGCADSSFLYDCRNCSNCYGCWNLRNAQYQIFNQQYTREDYLIKLNSFRSGSYSALQEQIKEFGTQSKGAIRKFADITHSTNVTGNVIRDSSECWDTFDVARAENCRYVWRLLEEGGADNYDITVGARPTLCYEGQGMGRGHASKFSLASGDVSFSEYAIACISGSTHLFGCVGLCKKQYCVLNKQYTKEEYEALVPRIKKHMDDMPYIDQKGRKYKYGEFFPPELSPFGYNETIAQEFFPLSKEEALAKGYTWRDRGSKDHAPSKDASVLPDAIQDVDDSILRESIGCEHAGKCDHQCTIAFRVTPEELSFYRRMHLPLPRQCSNCRHYERLAKRNPLKLWHRTCMCDKTTHQHGTGKCQNEFETSYSPDRKEVVYCEGCYNAEVV